MLSYSINIAKAARTAKGLPIHGRYVHFCKVDAGDYLDQARIVFQAMVEAFPSPLYQVTMTRWTTIGTNIA